MSRPALDRAGPAAASGGARGARGARGAGAPAPDPGNDVGVGREVGDRVTLRIANQTLAFRAAGEEVRLFLHDSHAPFRVPDDEPADCELVWSIEPLARSPGPPVLSYERRWEIRELAGGGEEITFCTAAPGDSRWYPTMQLVSDPGFRRVLVRQAPRGEPLAYVSEYPWAEYVMQRRLGLYGGAILHASMVVIGGTAHLFAGHSGAGKSTIAELAEGIGAEVPTDDRTIVTVDGGRAYAWGTPWHGSFRRTAPTGAPLGSISLLVQDRTDRIEPIGVARAVQEMLVRTVQTRLTAVETHRTLDTLERVARSAPCFELRFRPTADAVRLVVAAAAGGRGG